MVSSDCPCSSPQKGTSSECSIIRIGFERVTWSPLASCSSTLRSPGTGTESPSKNRTPSFRDTSIVSEGRPFTDWVGEKRRRKSVWSAGLPQRSSALSWRRNDSFTRRIVGSWAFHFATAPGTMDKTGDSCTSMY